MYVVKCMRFEEFEQGKTSWQDPSHERQSFDSESKAWKWAEARSQSDVGKGSVYQVFRENDNTKVGSPYYHGEIYRPTYVLQFRELTPGALWNWFDTGDKIGREYTLEEACDRVRSCFFSGKHEVRITRQSNPVEHVYQGTPTQAELNAWIDHYVEADDYVAALAITEKESEMHLSKPLNIPTVTMAGKIKTFLDEKQAEYDEKVALATARNEKRLEVFNALIAAEPNRILTFISQGNGSALGEKVSMVADGKKSQEDLLTEIGNWAEFSEVGPQPHYAEAEKILSVLEATSDETIEVSTDSDLYRYL